MDQSSRPFIGLYCAIEGNGMFSLPAVAAGESRLYFPVVSSTHPKVAQEALWSVVTENSIFFNTSGMKEASTLSEFIKQRNEPLTP